MSGYLPDHVWVFLRYFWGISVNFGFFSINFQGFSCNWTWMHQHLPLRFGLTRNLPRLLLQALGRFEDEEGAVVRASGVVLAPCGERVGAT